MKDPDIFLSFLAEYHRAMLRASRDPEIVEETRQVGDPILWPTAKLRMQFWDDGENGKIVLAGNTLLWPLSLFVLIFNIAWIAARYLREGIWGVDRTEGLLLIGYAMNYLPFFMIERSMYLYHYFAAILFLFLLAPRVLLRIRECIILLTNDRAFANAFLSLVGVLIVLNFVLLAPTTYGL